MNSDDKLIEGRNHLGRRLADLEAGLLSQTCTHCGEPVLPGEPRVPIEGPPLHYECGVHLVAGGVDDEVGMTRREAAKVALKEYLAHNPPPTWQ